MSENSNTFKIHFLPNDKIVEINEGDTVHLVIRNIDVSHGIAIPDFGVSERLEPGKVTEVEFVADKAGNFPFFCSVFCGNGHSAMTGTLIVS